MGNEQRLRNWRPGRWEDFEQLLRDLGRERRSEIATDMRDPHVLPHIPSHFRRSVLDAIDEINSAELEVKHARSAARETRALLARLLVGK